ncbi:hypothetical protein TYRP_022426 [Tyrophagus putrescentiae]|nr:hypothetical protein TYRP_022426 [Tyrophagus putrescentiae]
MTSYDTDPGPRLQAAPAPASSLATIDVINICVEASWSSSGSSVTSQLLLPSSSSEAVSLRREAL